MNPPDVNHAASRILESHRWLQVGDRDGDLADVFETDVERPVNLRLFPTEESYRQVNLLADEAGQGFRTHPVG